jgi:hypothetical protein
MIAFAPATPADIPLSQRLAREIWHEHYPSIMDDHRWWRRFARTR